MYRWFVKVLFEDGNIIGTKEEIEAYYAKGKVFNLGSVNDDLKRVNKILELRKIED